VIKDRDGFIRSHQVPRQLVTNFHKNTLFSMRNEVSETIPSTSRTNEDEIARKRAERAARKLEKELEKERQAKGSFTSKTLGFLHREWGEIIKQPVGQASRVPTRILTWNVSGRLRPSSVCKAEGTDLLAIFQMLAQCLVRRELFPGSDCLKGKDRLPTLLQEVVYYDPDIACLQVFLPKPIRICSSSFGT
jgi:hypothetical protein